MAQQLYFVTALSNAARLKEKLYATIPNPGEMVFEVAPDKWFVSYDGISSQLAELLEIRTTPHIATGLVLPVQSYSGRAVPQLWEWLKLRMA